MQQGTMQETYGLYCANAISILCQLSSFICISSTFGRIEIRSINIWHEHVLTCSVQTDTLHFTLFTLAFISALIASLDGIIQALD
jgi:hypothetical protein